MALADYSNRGPNLTKRDRAALRWAAKKADAWYGNVTGSTEAELHHLKQMDKVQDALLKLGIRIKRQFS